MTVEIAKRTRFSLVGVSVLFFFIFSGLFCGFLIAHFFPEQVMHVIYGVGTEPPPIPKKADPVDAAPDPANLAADGSKEEGGRERDLPVSSALPPSPELPVSKAADVAALDARDDGPRFVKHRKPAPPKTDVPPAVASAAPATAVPVPSGQATSSYLPSAQYPAAEWRRIDAQAGYVDKAVIVATGEKASDIMPKATDSLDVSGWVGDPALGLRFKDVLFAVCGKIVGHAKVGSPRPDVAKAVHPNLTPSGWNAKLYVGYLPRCPGASLLVLGVVPGSMTVVSVGEPIPLKLPPAEKPPANAPKGAPLYTPKNVVAARFVTIDIVPDAAELRRCGAVDCPTVAQVTKGRYQGHIAEEAGSWVLLILSDKAGWLPRTQIALGP